MTFAFEPEKALVALIYTANRVRGQNMYLTLKTLYMADKLSLERYGRFTFGDWYCAMQYGPVGSHAYDIVKHARGDNRFCEVNGVRDAMSIADNQILTKRDADTAWLSESDLECLDEAISNYGTKSFSEAKDASHDAAWHATSRNARISTEAIATTLAEPTEIIQYLANRAPGG